MSPSEFVLLLSLLALAATKAADFITTIRHVGPCAELNPLARRLFARFGFGRGLAVVGVIWLAIVAATYVTAFWQPSEIYQWLTSTFGFLISFGQWEAARFNAGGRPGRMTSWLLRIYQRWSHFWRHRDGR